MWSRARPFGEQSGGDAGHGGEREPESQRQPVRQHLGHLPLRWKLPLAYMLADNPYALCIARFTDHPADAHKLEFYLGATFTVWLVWQLAVLAGALVGAGLPASWRLEFAAPLAFIAISVPLLRDRAMVFAALATSAFRSAEKPTAGRLRPNTAPTSS